MRTALALARRGLGRVAPNPAVGCVVLRDGLVVGRGWTQPGGRPHAETEALRRAGPAAAGGTAYVTLEPCVHFGRTPPCTQALLQAGIRRCVVACRDPDPRVNGAGIAALRAAGVQVDVGLCAAESEAINRGFILAREQARPLVTLKLASSLDGRIATSTGESRWITGPEARARVHLLRAQHDAVMVGAGTARADDPRLDVRLPGFSPLHPVRVVLASRAGLPAHLDLVARASEQPTWMVVGEAARGLPAAVETILVAADEAGRPRPLAALQALAARGITRVLLEGGGGLAAAFLAAGLVDQVAWFHAGKALGGDGRPAVAPFGLAELAAAPTFRLESSERLGDDLLQLRIRATEVRTTETGSG